jgi:hypothetical protein
VIVGDAETPFAVVIGAHHCVVAGPGTALRFGLGHGRTSIKEGTRLNHEEHEEEKKRPGGERSTTEGGMESFLNSLAFFVFFVFFVVQSELL